MIGLGDCRVSMTRMPFALLGVAVACLCFAMWGVAPTSAASTAAPWWGLTFGVAPTDLPQGLARDEVQEITYSPGDEGLQGFKLEIDKKLIAVFTAVSTASEVQKALESATAYGAGNVLVSGGPAGTAPLFVTNVGEDADQPVAPLELVAIGTGATGKTAVVTEGRPDGQIVVTAENLGDADANGATKIIDVPPKGLKAVGITGSPRGTRGERTDGAVTCSLTSLSCEFAGTLPPYEELEVIVSVVVEAGTPSGEENEATVSGGGAATSRTIRRPIQLGETTPFGVEGYGLALEEEGGSLDTQAGSHPFQLTTTLALNQVFSLLEGSPALQRATPTPVKDLNFNLPPGLLGNPTVFPQCTELQFTTFLKSSGDQQVNKCPPDTAMGVVSVAVNLANEIGFGVVQVPLFNLVPSVGEPARFGFDVDKNLVTLDTSVRTGGDYGVVVSVDNTTQSAVLLSSAATFWGVPGDPRHDESRGWECLNGELGCVREDQKHPAPFLVLPTSCTGPLQTTVEANAWTQPSFLTFDPSEPEESLDGCERLGFEPSLEVAPDREAASTPTGLTVGVKVPQEIDLNPEGLSESDVKSITVALPEGVQINPSGGNGLQACSDAQIGFTGFAELNPQSEPGVKTAQFKEKVYNETTKQEEATLCPDASKVATVNIRSPLLPDELEGEVYLAAPQNFAGPPQENPFESLVAMYIVAEDPVAGVLVKLPVRVSPDPVTGQLTATVDSPQLPFENAELHYFGGERAPLSTPALCGTYTTRASLTPWSGGPAAGASSAFDVVSGPDETGLSGCSEPRRFAPGFQAGSTNLQAGAFTPFTTTMTRPDADQTLGRIEMQMPPGLSGTLSGVKLCGEAQANAGTCGPESLIGSTVVSAGLGSDPYTVTGGKVYITEGYGGGQFGLSIVNPAAAGPFVLDEGRPVVVRAAIFVDPHTAALRIVSDPLPTMLDGIPLQIQHVNVTIERPGGQGFTFNPTNCAKTAINATISSSQGANAGESTPFQVTNCASLKFEPKFAASTSGKTSKADGASLTVKLTYPSTPQGTEANIAKVKVDLPKQLPSRLTTLQKACLAVVFEANPAACPVASVVGHARALTPIIPVPLEGPAYFVSHGGEAFPSLIFVLQGAAPYNVTVDLVGTTFINKAGITSSTFEAVPDVPVGSFELNLPQERYSALGANLPAKDRGSFCGQKLALPTAFVSQDGTEIHASTPLSVSGCKPAIAVIRHKVKGETATLAVSVPSAGKLVASARGLSRATARAKKAGTVTVKMALSRKQRAFLAKHHGRKLRAKVTLSFTPKKGNKLKTTVTVLIG